MHPSTWQIDQAQNQERLEGHKDRIVHPVEHPCFN